MELVRAGSKAFNMEQPNSLALPFSEQTYVIHTDTCQIEDSTPLYWHGYLNILFNILSAKDLTKTDIFSEQV